MSVAPPPPPPPPITEMRVVYKVPTHPAGEHGFDILNDDDRSCEIIARTLDFLKHHLLRP